MHFRIIEAQIELDDLSIVLEHCVNLGFLEKVVAKKYKFAHDKILQGAYSLLSEGERLKVHYQAGLMFADIWSKLRSQQLDDNKYQVLLLSVFRFGIAELLHGILRSPASKFRNSNSYQSSR